MKRKSIISLLCLAFATCVFAGCEQISGLFGGEQEEPHTHTYATEWSKDKEGHWYDATCECEDVEITKIAHVDKNNDSLCDICEYDYNHTHTYEEDTWTVNCEQHWHAATCGHVVVGIDAADHADENADGKCDTCGYVIEDIHVHVYEDDVWVTDGEYHWHAALCEHKAEIADKEAHVLNAAGDCTVCGENVNPVDVTKIEAVLAAAQANEYKIVDGAVIADVEVYGGTGKEDLEQSSTDEVYFVLGNSETYIKTKSETIDYTQNSSGSGVEEEWYQDLGNDDIFGVILEDGAEELAPTMGSAQKMKGYNYIPGSILPSDADDTSTLANTLSGLYNQMKAGVRVSNAKESVKDGVYTFSYTYYSVNANTSSTTANGDGTGAVTSTKVNSVEIELYNAQVEFTVNEDLIIDAATFSVEVYRDYDADSDLLYTYVDNGDGTVTLTSEVTLKDTANPSVYTFNVAQHSGVRTFTTPYPRSSLIPTSFEFSYINEYDYPDAFDFQIISETLIGDSLTLQEGEYAYFHIGDLKPITASSKFMSTEDFTYTFVNKDSSSTAICWDVNDTLLNGYSQYIDCLKLKILDPGEYTVTITFGNMSKTFDVTVKAEELPEVGDDDDANTINVATTDTYTFSEDDLFSYTAAEEGTYIFNLPAGLGFWSRESYDSYGAPEMDFYDNVNGESVEFDLAAGETLEFYVGAITKGTWVITVEFEVGGGDEGGNEGGGETSGTIGNIVGTYYSGTCVLVINDDGTMTFTNGSTVSNYTYEINGNTVTYTLNGNAPYTSDNPMAVYFGYLTFDSDGMPATFVNNGTTYALTTEGGSEDEGGNGGEVATGGTTDNPYVIGLGQTSLTVTQTHVDAWGVYATFTAEESGWYLFKNCGVYSWNDATYESVSLESDEGNIIYIKANTALKLIVGVEEAGTIVADVSKAEVETLGVGTHTVTNDGTLYGTSLVVSVPTTGTYEFSIEDKGAESIGVYNMTIGDLGYDYSVFSKKAELEAGEVYLVNVYFPSDANWDPLAGSWTITIAESTSEDGGDEGETTEPDGSEENPYVVTDGFSKVLAADYSNPIFVKVTAGVTATIDGDAAFYADPADFTAIGTSVTPDVDTVYCIYSTTWAGATVMLTGGVSGGEEGGDEDVEVDYETIIVAGTNTLYFSAEEISADTAERTATIEVAGNYSFSSGILFVGSVTDSTGAAVTKNDDYTYTLAAGTYTVKFSMLSMFGVAADQACELNVEKTSAGEDGGEEGEPEADGSEEKPYILTEVGDYTCAFPGGWSSVFYAYTPSENGYVTVSTTFNGAGWLQVGTDLYSLVSNAGSGESVSAYVQAGQLCYIGVADWDEAVIDVPFSVAFEAGEAVPDGTAAMPYALEAENTCAFPGGYNNVFYTYTAETAGTLTVTITSDDYWWGYGSSEWMLTYVQAASENIILEEGQTILIGVSTYSALEGTITFTATFGEGEEGGDEDVEVDYETIIVAGTNTLYFSAEEISADTAERTATIEVAGNYSFSSGILFVGSVTDSTGAAVTKNDDYTYTLAAGTYTVKFSMLGMFGASADTAIELNVENTSATEEDDGETEGGEEGGNGSGTSADPYVITELPFEVTFESTHDVYYTYTATEACTLSITCPAGCLVSGTGATKDDAGNYTVVVAAGQTLSINPWSNGGTAPYTYTISKVEVVEPTPGEGEEGGEVVGNSVVYLGANGSGRAMQITVDATAGTVSVIRAALAGNSLNTASGATEYTGTYSYDGSAVTCEISGCTITWNADGSPASVVWGSATYTDFTVQA